MQQIETTQDRPLTRQESQLVTFLLKEEEFGFDIMSVQEIIRLPKMAKVPRTPPYVEGIANLRGVVLPIIDMRTRFGMERAADTDRTRVLVVDIDGTKTGLRVDRVKQVARVLPSDVDPPPPSIRGTTADYLDGVVKLDNGQRIILALNTARVCQMDIPRADGRAAAMQAGASEHGQPGAAAGADRQSQAVVQLVTFRIAREEFAFPMENVREILRVQPPKEVPDVPEYVLGVLSVRGQILPILDLRQMLHQPSLAEECAGRCRLLGQEYQSWLDRAVGAAAGRLDLSAPEELRSWLSTAASSSQVLMEILSRLRGLNERTIKLAQSSAPAEDLTAAVNAVLGALADFEREAEAGIQEDQRIIVVDANGFVLGLVVDRVNEVLNLPRNLLDRPPVVTASDGMELEAVAKLDDGNRLIMLLDVKSLMRDQRLSAASGGAAMAPGGRTGKAAGASSGDGALDGETQLVTFLLAGEEYGVPISQIHEIDRIAKITKVPRAAPFVEGVTNLRGEVIPVIDARRRFELEPKPADDRSRVIILELGGVKTGLIVDSVREVLSIPKRHVAPPPEAIHSGIDQRFVSGIGQVEEGKRMVVLLDVGLILSAAERSELEQMASPSTGNAAPRAL